MRDPAEGLDLGPPDAAVADADPVDVERLRNDHMVDPRRGEEPLLRQPGDSAIAAGFLVDGAGDLQSPGQLGATFQEGLDGDDRSGQAALHVAGAAPEHLAVTDLARPRIHAPSLPRRHHVDVAVEVHAWPRPAALAAGDHVDARMARGVAGRAFGAQIADIEAAAA